ncbi:MAG: PAS domain S-box protein [Candidatus Bathyarchaeia archaeon]
MENIPNGYSKNNFFDLLNLIADPIAIVDDKGCILLVNDAFEEFTAISKSEVIGKIFLQLSIVKPESKELLWKNLKKRMQGLPVEPYEISFIDRYGETKFAKVNAKRIIYAGQPVDIVIFHDITQIKCNFTKIKEYSEEMEALVEDKIKKIKESEEKFRAIAMSAVEAIALIDGEGKIIYWNPGAEKIFGYTQEEIVGKEVITTLIPPQYRMFIPNFAADILNNRWSPPTNPFEFTFLRKNGNEFSVELSITLLTLKGKPCLLAIVRDISERKKLEERLQAAERRYYALFNQAHLGILLLDPKNGKAVEFNEEAHRQLGYSREEFAKLTVSDYEAIESPEEIRARMKRILSNGKETFETKHRTKNGEIRDVINTVNVIELNGKKFLHVTTLDVTEQRKFENALKMERDKLECITENIGAGVGIISKDYRIIWVNNYLKKCSGDCEGKPCYSIFAKRDTVCPDCSVKKVFEEGLAFHRHEYFFTDCEGNPRWAELIATPIKDKGGNIIAALELTVDITEKKLLQKRLEEYSQKLEQLVDQKTKQLKEAQAKLLKAERFAAIGELAGMIGHDLRNPLTGIKAAVYYLKTKCATNIDSAGNEMLKTIEKAIAYSNKIVNDLLEYSNQPTLDPIETTPKMLLKNALSHIEIPERIKIVDATKNKHKLKVDPDAMCKVFCNIITNALDAMPTSGTLTITSKAKKQEIAIAFQDTGTGMTEETLNKLKLGFPLFTTKAKGMGFGLPICKRIIEAHGGKISLKSELGKGTIVTITLPTNPKRTREIEQDWIFNESALNTSAVVTPSIANRYKS